MDTVTPMNAIVDELSQASDVFRDIALGDGVTLATLLLLVGLILIVFSIGFFGYLTLGAVVDLVVPE